MTSPQLIVLQRASGGEIGPHQPKVTATTPGMTEAVQKVWEHPQTRTAFGFWECSAGSFGSRRDGYAEICHILQGEATLHTDGGPAVTLVAGDAVIMPSGWTGQWEVHSPVRKLYVTIPDA